MGYNRPQACGIYRDMDLKYLAYPMLTYRLAEKSLSRLCHHFLLLEGAVELYSAFSSFWF